MSIQLPISHIQGTLLPKEGSLKEDSSQTFQNSQKNLPADAIRQALERGEIVEFEKGQYKTRDLIPRNKQRILGEGSYGTVAEHQDLPNRVIKASTKFMGGLAYRSFVDEWKIGTLLSKDLSICPHFPRTYGLLIKRGRKTCRLMMEKIEGKTLGFLERTFQNVQVIQSLFTQAEKCCLYLLKKNILCEDIKNENMMLDLTTSPPRLVLIDFGAWIELSPNSRSVTTLALTIHMLNKASEMIFPISQLYHDERAHLSLEGFGSDEDLKRYPLSEEEEKNIHTLQDRSVWLIKRHFQEARRCFEQSSLTH